jgi:ABC-2 type transport system ATP-binding protein
MGRRAGGGLHGGGLDDFHDSSMTKYECPPNRTRPRGSPYHRRVHGSASLSLTAVTVTYRSRGGTRTALNDVHVDVGAGEVVAVCGRNGAGKTTLLDVATGFRRPNAGRAAVCGVDPGRLTADGRARMGVALADSGLPPTATGRRVLTHLARLYRQPVDLADLVDRLDLQGVLGRPVRRMSTGQRQRLAVAGALIGRPDVLVLDEPTSFLDAAGRRTVVSLLREAGSRGAAVLWTSHTMQDVARASDRVVVLDRGLVLADAAPDALTGATDVVRFDASPGADVDALRAALPTRLAASEAAPGAYEVVGVGVDPGVLTTVSAWQAAHGGSGRLSIGPRELEDVLLGLTGHPPGASPADGPMDLEGKAPRRRAEGRVTQR